MNYLYNGVELPALPEWDKTQYPYAVITNDYTGNGYAYYLTLLGADSYYYEKDTSVYFGGSKDLEMVPCLRYKHSNGVWGEVKSYDNYQIAVTFHVMSTKVWSNFDIEYNGTLYLAASTPVPVGGSTTLDPTALLMGWMVGKRMAGLRKTQTDVPVVPDEPIAYLYNGVRLPDINEVWTDKETYKYACIYPVQEAPGIYILWIDGGGFGFIESLNSAMPSVISAPSLSYLCITDPSLEGDGVVANVWYEAEPQTPYLPIWTNSDILYGTYEGGTIITDGTTYLAASEPVPVYE